MKYWISFFLVTALSAQAQDWGMAERLFTDRIARRVGDLLTVEISESSSVSKDAAADRSKNMSSQFGFDLPGMTKGGISKWAALALPDWGVDGSRSYDNSGSKTSSDQFSASITVHITEVLPNGNMLISGDRVVNIDGDILKFNLSGIVRPDDIDSSNKLDSTSVAGATITYETTGEFARTQRTGILTRIIDWINPF